MRWTTDSLLFSILLIIFGKLDSSLVMMLIGLVLGVISISLSSILAVRSYSDSRDESDDA